MALRLVFMGTPDFAVPTLVALHEAGHDIIACYSQPPRPAGRRGLDLTPSPVHKMAEDLAVPVFTPQTLKDGAALTHLASLEADAFIVVAYGQILPANILDLPEAGCFNGHASLLPRWRGAAPIQRAIMAGDEETGVCIMLMETGLDTGPVCVRKKCPIDNLTTAGSLHDDLATLTAELMCEAMRGLGNATLTFEPQAELGITYASKIDKAEARIDFSKDAQSVHRHIMGLSPFPGAWCEMPLSGKRVRVKILRTLPVSVQSTGEAGTVLDDKGTIACGSGAVRLVEVQKAGAKAGGIEEFLRGNPLPVGTILP